MKVAALADPATLESLKVEDRPEPEVRPGAVKVRWKAASLNFHDFAVAAGLLPAAAGRVLVSDAAGEVVEIGDLVSEWSPGDKVMSTFFPDWIDGQPTSAGTASVTGDTTDGCAAELGVLPESALTHVPDDWSFAEAATLPCAGLTAWRALYDIADLQAGQTVLVQGSGGVSIFALQLAKATGARVYATTSSAEKADRLRALGADHVINYAEDPSWGETVAEATDGGVDVVLDVGGPSTLPQSIVAGRCDAHLILIGVLGGMEASLNIPQLLFKQQRIRPIAVGSHAQQRRLVDHLAGTGIRPVIDRSFSLDEIADGLGHLSGQRHFGKVIIDIASA